MVRAARTAEFEHYQRNRGPHERFRPLSDRMLRAIIEAALSVTSVEDEAVPEPMIEEPSDDEPPRPRAPRGPQIVTARKPKPRRGPNR